jgi:PEGA domain
MTTSTTRWLRPLALALVPVVLLTLPTVASAQRRGRRPATVVVPGGFYGPLYDPFYGPFYGPYYPGPYGPGSYTRDGGVRLKVRPRDASVYVDGYYAGIVDDFDGVFQSLSLEPGGHHIEIRMPGYRTLSVDLLIQRGHTMTYHGDLVPDQP